MRQWVASLFAAAVGVAVIVMMWQPEPAGCEVCKRPLHQATSYVMTTAGADQVNVCCPRCGLHYQGGRSDIAEVKVADFTSGTLIDATRATFVEASDVHLCCLAPQLQEDRSGSQYGLAWDRCMPSLVAFEFFADALEFQGRSGGRLRTYDDLLAEEQAAVQPPP